MMITCDQARRLVSEAQDEELKLKDRLALGFHLFICKLCAAYEKQIVFVRSAVRKLCGEFTALNSEGLSLEARERIRKSVKLPES